MDGFPRTGLCCHSCVVHCSLRKQCTDRLVALGWRRQGRGGQRRIRKVSGDSLYSEKTSGWWRAVGIDVFYRNVRRSKDNQSGQV